MKNVEFGKCLTPKEIKKAIRGFHGAGGVGYAEMRYIGMDGKDYNHKGDVNAPNCRTLEFDCLYNSSRMAVGKNEIVRIMTLYTKNHE